MKKIINGRIYDTDKAFLIGTRSSGENGKFTYLEESLYQTPVSKRYFLAGTSGPYGPYAKSIWKKSIYTFGEGVRPLTKEQAAEWKRYYLNQ